MHLYYRPPCLPTFSLLQGRVSICTSISIITSALSYSHSLPLGQVTCDESQKSSCLPKIACCLPSGKISQNILARLSHNCLCLASCYSSKRVGQSIWDALYNSYLLIPSFLKTGEHNHGGKDSPGVRGPTLPWKQVVSLV